MNVLLVLSCIVIIILALYGYRSGFVKMLLPFVSGILSLLFLFLLKDWLFGFLFRWTIFGGEHILARVVVILAIYFLGTFALKWLMGVLKLLTKLPGVHGVNRLLGLAIGMLEGFLLVWLLLYILQLKQGILFGIDCNQMIAQSRFLSFLSLHNFIAHLIGTLFSGWIV